MTTTSPMDRRRLLHLGSALLSTGFATRCTHATERTNAMTTTTDATTTRHAPSAARPRAIAHRSRGQGGGFITRLMSPGDLGQIARPFVFLDRFEAEMSNVPSLDMGWHPHSGIATVTVVLEGATRYAETTGNTGVVPAGGVEWMRAGAGVWHTGTMVPGVIRGFQLWVALPPTMEEAPCESRYVQPEEVPVVGPARVILGAYGGATSPIASPPMTYLTVSLRDGERWTFDAPDGHDVAWVALMDGALRTSSRITRGELAIFERAVAPIEFVAEGDTRFVLGSAPQHPHELVLGSYSVHTSRAALERGEREIRRIGGTLRAEGKQSYALRTFG